MGPHPMSLWRQTPGAPAIRGNVPSAVLRRGHVHVCMQSDQASSASALARLALRLRALRSSCAPRGPRGRLAASLCVCGASLVLAGVAASSLSCAGIACPAAAAVATASAAVRRSAVRSKRSSSVRLSPSVLSAIVGGGVEGRATAARGGSIALGGGVKFSSYVRAQVMQRGWRHAVGGRRYRT